MKRWQRRWIWWSVLSCGSVLCSLASLAQSRPTLSGVIRDADGKTLAGVAITLTGKQLTPQRLQTASNAAGIYSFIALAAGDYTISAELSGYTAITAHTLRIEEAAQPVVADLTLARLAAPPLQFKASGLHGLIDPGGYSAAANADAASGLVRSIAELKRADTTISAFELSQWPCSLLPKLKTSLAADPQNFAANLKLGQFYVVHHQPALAIPLLHKALQVEPLDFQATRQLAIAFLQSGEFQQARSVLTPVAEQPGIHVLLAKADEGSSLFQQAAQEYEFADREASSEQNTLNIGYEYVLAGSLEKAMAVFEAGRKKYPRSVLLRIGTGTVQFLQGHAADAVHSFLAATQLDPDDARPYSFLAAASSISDTDGEVVGRSFKAYLVRNPGSANANYFYALVLERENADASAARIQTLLRRALELDPTLARAHLQLADLYARQRDLKQALPEYETALRLAPSLAETHYRLALAYKRTGQPEQSEQQMKIFQQIKSSQAFGNDDINIAQFISVIDLPEAQTGIGSQCNTSVP